MSAPRIDLTELRSRTPLLSLISRRVALKRRSRWHVGCCPFHAEKTPSFYVYPDNHFHCFGCNAHGDAIGFTMRTEGLDFGEAVERLAAEAGMDGAEQLSRGEWQRRQRAAAEARRRAEARQEQLQADADADAIAYVRRRLARTVSLSETLAERYLTERRRHCHGNQLWWWARRGTRLVA